MGRANQLGVDTIKMDPMQVQRIFTEALVGRKDVSDAAAVVMTRSIGTMRINAQEAPDSWNLRMGAMLDITGKEGELLWHEQARHEVNTMVFTEKASALNIKDILVDMAGHLIHDIAKKGDTIPKLALLWADEIAEMQAEMAAHGKNTFNPEVWSNKILNSYKDSLLVKSLMSGGQNNPSAVIGTIYGKDVTAGDSQALKIVARNNPEFKNEGYRW